MKHNLANLKGDLFGGITSGIVALPLALAFGVISGLGPEAGLYGAMILGFFAALFGGTPTQISGPTGPMTVMSAVVIANAISFHGSVDAALGPILLTFALAGLIQIIFGFLRIGEYVQFIPNSVISGFMSGIGVIIILLQLFPMLGATSPNSVIAVIKQLPSAIENIHWISFALTLGTIAIIYVFPLLTRILPSSLASLIVMTMISIFWQLPVTTIGSIPEGLPQFHWQQIWQVPFFSQANLIIIPALTIAALGVIDSLLTSVVADNLTKTRHNSNQELIGQGIGNTLSALFGGLPGAGATMRTVVNINAGAHSRLSGMVHSIVLLLILVGPHAYAAQIPMPVLAGILITVGINIIDYKSLKHMRHAPWADTAVMLIVFSMTVFVDLLQAVIVGFVLASVLFMKKMSDIVHEKSIGTRLDQIAGSINWLVKPNIPEVICNQVYIKYLYGPLFFGFTRELLQRITRVTDIKIFIIRMGDVPHMDQSGLYAIEEAIQYLESKNVQVYITEIQAQPRDLLTRLKIIPILIPEQALFDRFEDCIHYILETHPVQD